MLVTLCLALVLGATLERSINGKQKKEGQWKNIH
jgi:hypothetical protein